MKKIFKNPIFTFILGAVIFGGITGVVAASLLAKDITYTPKDTTWKKSNGEDITNVEDAIDELYEKTSLFKTLNVSLQARSWSSSSDSSALLSFHSFQDKYKYFEVTSLNNNNLRSCFIYRWDKNTQTEIEVQLNTKYSTSSNANVFINVINNNNTYGTCTANILMYN